MLCKGCSIAALLFSVGSLPWLPSEGDCNCDITRVLGLNYFSGLIFDRIVHGSYWLAKLMSGHIPSNLIQKSFFEKWNFDMLICNIRPTTSSNKSSPISSSTSILVYHVVGF